MQLKDLKAGLAVQGADKALYHKAEYGAQAEAGNILFTRVLGGTPHQFFYHLYTVKRLRAELLEAGFVMTTASAESLLPEWLITQHPWLGRADALLSRALPAALGYGIRAVARPV